MRIDWSQRWNGPGVESLSAMSGAAIDTGTPASFLVDWRCANWHLLGTGYAWTGQAITGAAPPPQQQDDDHYVEYDRYRRRRAQGKAVRKDQTEEIAALLLLLMSED